MALQLSYTDPDTLAIYPVAYLRIDNIALTHLATGGGSLIIGIYANQQAAQGGGAPIKRINFVLSDSEATVLRNQGLALLYGIVTSRQEYSTAVSA